VSRHIPQGIIGIDADAVRVFSGYDDPVTSFEDGDCEPCAERWADPGEYAPIDPADRKAFADEMIRRWTVWGALPTNIKETIEKLIEDEHDRADEDAVWGALDRLLEEMRNL
jgi:hypothetical protein